MIKVNSVVKNYGNFRALDNITFEVKKGEIIGLLGPNGAGKTTTMRILSGFMPADSGYVYLNSHEVHEQPLETKKIVGYMPENPPLYTEMKIKDYLRFTAEIKQVPKQKIQKQIDYVMDAVGISERADTIINKLSKGFRQRVGLAMALINEPEILILDEPSIGLDPNQIIEIRTLIKNLAGSRTIILSSHILPEVQEVCERVIIISKGKIIAQDSHKGLQKMARGGGKISVSTDSDIRKAIDIIKKIEGISSITQKGEGKIELTAEDQNRIKPEIARQLVKNNINLLELAGEKASLEEIFHKLTLEEK